MKNTRIFHDLIKLSFILVSSGLLVLGTACGSSSSANSGNDAGGSGGSGGAAGGGDTAKYNFEGGMTQGWVSGSATDPFTSVMSSTAQHFAGTSSLAAAIDATAASLMSYSLEVNISPAVMIAADTHITFHVYVPADAPIDWIQPFIQEDVTFSFIGVFRGTGTFTKGGWSNVDVIVPTTVVNPIYKVGVQVHTMGAWTGTIYVDSVNW
jgi:hypothetical protein